MKFESRWDMQIDQPQEIIDPGAFHWDESADVVVVGLGGAGIAAALEAVEYGLSVCAVDRYQGGGSSAANGGVFYAGGGTKIQRDAGESDSVDEMFKYLKLEVGGVISDETLLDFCRESAGSLDWLIGHGAKFQGKVYKKKTGYPPLDYFLYHADSSLAEPYATIAKPAARGHRVVARNGKKAWGLGKGIYDPLRAAALRRGMAFRRFAEARQLACDRQSRIIGVRVLQIPEGSRAARLFAKYTERAEYWLAMLPPTVPGAFVTHAIGAWYLKRAQALERKHRVSAWIRARRGIVLSAGGFIRNTAMVRHFAPKYGEGMPLGTVGDTGAGIMLGASAGGALKLMERVSAWRFINPPKAWSCGMLVNAQGARFINETVYGAAIGDAIVEEQNGHGYLILDQTLRDLALKQAMGPEILPMHRDVALLNTLLGAKKGRTLDDLARAMGFDPAVFRQTTEAYNRAARGQSADAFQKRAEDMAELSKGPFYAIDASVSSKLMPLACITLGGLGVNEATGGVLNMNGETIPGLFAAGRNAVGVCSHLYVSGLSYADCIYSGRRAARAMAAQLEHSESQRTG